MPPQRRVSGRQMELLVEFAESHRDIALGRFPGGPQAARVTREAWDSIAGQLNVVAEGTTKTPDQWRRYWIEFKAKTKAKAADSRRNAAATGGGPNKLVPLNAIEERVLAIIGAVAVEGLPGVRLPIDTSVDEIEAPVDSGITALNPVISYSTTSTSNTQSLSTVPNPESSSSVPNTVSSEPVMYEEWLEDEIPQPQSQTFTLPPSACQLANTTHTAVIPTQLDEQPGVSSTENRPAQHFTPPDTRSRSRLRRPINRDERVPRWAYDIEMRRIAAEERHAAAMEAMVELIKEIRDDVHNYVNR